MLSFTHHVYRKCNDFFSFSFLFVQYILILVRYMIINLCRKWWYWQRKFGYFPIFSFLILGALQITFCFSLSENVFKFLRNWFQGFEITKKNHCDRDIFEHNFRLWSLKLCSNISLSQWFFIVISNPGFMVQLWMKIN